MSSDLKIGDELDIGYLNNRHPVERITVRRATEAAFDVLRIKLDPKRAPSENERRVVTYGRQEPAVDHARQIFASES